MTDQLSIIKFAVQQKVIESLAVTTELFSYSSGKTEPNNLEWYSQNITEKFTSCCLFYPTG